MATELPTNMGIKQSSSLTLAMSTVFLLMSALRYFTGMSTVFLLMSALRYFTGNQHDYKVKF